MEPNNLLTTKEAAEYLGVSQAYLERDRWKGAIVPFCKIGGRTVRYRKSDLDGFIDNCMGPWSQKDLLGGASTND